MSATSTQFHHYALETGSTGEPRALSADGTGATYRAYDQRTHQAVLLRIFSDKLLADAAVQREFVHHARWLIELDHPRVTRIIDTGNCGEQFYYVLENPGGELVEEMVASSGPLGVEHALTLQLQLAEVLMAVRSHPGLLSRVWPRNLMVGGRGSTPSIHVIAQNLIAAIDPVEQPEYLAPEILAGHRESEQSILYSIGATLFFMLSGRPPYPAHLASDDLLEFKFKQLPDMAILPLGTPYPLLRQLLAAEPGNRPQSIEAWERALRQFLQFTPAATGRVHVLPAGGAASVPTPLTPFRVTGSSAGGPANVASGNHDELQQAKEHTQRLSLELTKRVQKELALTEQLERLEQELGAERARVRELTSRHQIRPSEEDLTHLKTEKTKIDEEWAAILAARKTLEREKSDFLKRTQRFSISQLKSELEPRNEAASQPTAKSRFFRFGKKVKSTRHKAAAILNREPKPGVNEVPSQQPGEAPATEETERIELGANGPKTVIGLGFVTQKPVAQKPADGVADEALPAAPVAKEKPGTTSSPEPEGERTERVAPEPINEEPPAERSPAEKPVTEEPPVAASPMEQPAVEVLDPDDSGMEAPVTAKPSEDSEENGDRDESGDREIAKVARRVEVPFVKSDDREGETEMEESAKKTAQTSSVTPFILAKPASASSLEQKAAPVSFRPESPSSEATALPLLASPRPLASRADSVQALKNEASADPVGPKAPAKPPLAEAQESHLPLPESGSRSAVLLKPPVKRTVYEPLPGAWVALVILGLVIASGLYLAYRTFFAMQDDGVLGVGAPNSPVVVELFEPAEDAEEPDPLEDADQPSQQGPEISERETQVNEELRVEMRAFENFLLVQDEAWKELLGGMQNLKQEEAAYSADERRQIRRELIEDLERKAQLSKDGHLRENPDFGEVYAYLKGVLASGDSGQGDAAVETEGGNE